MLPRVHNSATIPSSLPAPPRPSLPRFNLCGCAAALVYLQKDLIPDNPPVAASAKYRKSLACSLFYKVFELSHMATNPLFVVVVSA